MKLRSQGPHWLDIDLHPYAGRYVALVEGRIAAVADSAEGAFARARRARPRRMPVILKIDEPHIGTSPDSDPTELEKRHQSS